MLGFGFFQALVTCGAAYAFYQQSLSHRWSLSAPQSIALGGVVGSLLGLMARLIYLYRKSTQKDDSMTQASKTSKTYYGTNAIETGFYSPQGLSGESSFGYFESPRSPSWSGSSAGSIAGSISVSLSGSDHAMPKEENLIKPWGLFNTSFGCFSSWKEIMDLKTGLVIPGAHNALSYLAETLSNLSLISMMG